MEAGLPAHLSHENLFENVTANRATLPPYEKRQSSTRLIECKPKWHVDDENCRLHSTKGLLCVSQVTTMADGSFVHHNLQAYWRKCISDSYLRASAVAGLENLVDQCLTTLAPVNRDRIYPEFIFGELLSGLDDGTVVPHPANMDKKAYGGKWR